MADRTLLTALENEMKKHAPGFEVKFKDQSTFMKIIGKALFFNKAFINGYITTIGKKVYWTNEENYESYPDGSFMTLAHEFVHVMDYIKKPVRFMLGYLFPQVLAAPGILFTLLLPVWLPLMILSIISPWWLLLLTSLAFLAPLPSPGRKTAEMRGYGMSCRTRVWQYGSVQLDRLISYVGRFTGPAYYFMWPFKKSVTKELSQYTEKEDPEFLKTDHNPAWSAVYKVLKDNGRLHE